MSTARRRVARISRTNMVKILKETNGSICTVTYRKVGGDERVMNCSTRGITNDLGYILVTDMQVRKTRKNPTPNRIKSVDPRTITELKAGGRTYRLKD